MLPQPTAVVPPPLSTAPCATEARPIGHALCVAKWRRDEGYAHKDVIVYLCATDKVAMLMKLRERAIAATDPEQRAEIDRQAQSLEREAEYCMGEELAAQR